MGTGNTALHSEQAVASADNLGKTGVRIVDSLRTHHEHALGQAIVDVEHFELAMVFRPLGVGEVVYFGELLSEDGK